MKTTCRMKPAKKLGHWITVSKRLIVSNIFHNYCLTASFARRERGGGERQTYISRILALVRACLLSNATITVHHGRQDLACKLLNRTQTRCTCKPLLSAPGPCCTLPVNKRRQARAHPSLMTPPPPHTHTHTHTPSPAWCPAHSPYT